MRLQPFRFALPLCQYNRLLTVWTTAKLRHGTSRQSRMDLFEKAIVSPFDCTALERFPTSGPDVPFPNICSKTSPVLTIRGMLYWVTMMLRPLFTIDGRSVVNIVTVDLIRMTTFRVRVSSYSNVLII